MRVTIFAAVCTALALMGQSVVAKTLTYGSGVPERAAANRLGVLPMLDRLTQVSDGEIRFTPILGGQLVSIPGGLPAIRDHVVDAGFFLTQFHPADMPAASFMAELTGLGTSPLATIGALNEIFFTRCPACMADMARQNVVPMMIQSATPLVLQCTGQVSDAPDLAGLRVAVIGQPEMRWIEALGAIPVRSSVSDILSALQLGQADCGLLPLSWIRSYGLQDTIRSVIDRPQGIITGAVPLAINADTWSTLPQTTRQKMIAAMPGIIHDYVTSAYVGPDDAVRGEMAERLHVSDGGPTLAAAWASFQKAEPTALIEAARAHGLENPEGFVAMAVETFRIWHEDLLPRFTDDPDTFTALLKARVYDAVHP
ncbi:hypothetical protein [Tistrella mobilis]|uniref:C4-dicarboxylate ABC transporter substrate-binding protein n=1 Tax=Tistrella mobilis (strain KA081020-065) TaxID=1110502 RepID=I3TLK3_TISMK|nr:hypothetical protein [Tistrella mobilis]AFK53641.1 hypothetical protein TMO_1802 [Tistrella mobilis KA081020-065]